MVLADANTLNAVFPGLGITLDNSSGPVHYIVTGVYPWTSLDGGTHRGYFTVFRPTAAYNAANPCLAGTTTTVYTGTTIGQDSFNWKTVTLM
jgi:hypothetical protein